MQWYNISCHWAINNDIFSCENENYTEIIIKHMDLEENRKGDVGLQIANRTDCANNSTSIPT